jgi:hypothetical protein
MVTVSAEEVARLGLPLVMERDNCGQFYKVPLAEDLFPPEMLQYLRRSRYDFERDAYDFAFYRRHGAQPHPVFERKWEGAIMCGVGYQSFRECWAHMCNLATLCRKEAA